MAIVETTGGSAAGGGYEGRDELKEFEKRNAEATADITVTRLRGLFSWQAIFAGAIGALGLHIVLMMLGMAFGFGATDPITDENPIAVFTGGTAIAWTISALLSLWAGGWIAGRAAAQIDRRAGMMHGMLVWSAATVATFLLLTTGVGLAIGGAAKVVGSGLTLAAAPVAAAAGPVGEVLKDAAVRNQDQIKSFISEATRAQGAPEDSAASIRATREIGRAAARFFAADDIGAADARKPMVQALVQFGGKSEADATRMVDEWTTSYRALQADLTAAKNKAEAEAREAGDKAAKALSIASFWGFIALLIGAASAICGGAVGAKCARTKLDPVVVSA